MILSGIRQGTLLDIRLIDIHGTRYYDLVYFQHDSPDQQRTARIGVEAGYPDPQPGDRIGVSYLMNVVVGVARKE